MSKYLPIALVAFLVLAGTGTHAASYQPLVSFGSGSFSVLVHTARYSQDESGISFGGSVTLGDTLGGVLPAPVTIPVGANELAISMRVTGVNQDLWFDVEIFDDAMNKLAKYEGNTSGLAEDSPFLPLTLTERFAPGATIGGIQFTWNGGGDFGVKIVALAVAVEGGGNIDEGEGGESEVGGSAGGGGGGAPASGSTVTPAPEGITSVKLLPSSRTVKAGKKTRLMVLVTNNSTQTEEVQVDFTSSNASVLSEPDSVDVVVPGKKRETQKAKTKRFRIVLETDEFDEGAAELTASIGSNVRSTPCRITIKPKKFKE